MKIGVDTTFFSHQEALKNKLSLSTSIFTADLLHAFENLGKSDSFVLFCSCLDYSYFAQSFPAYKVVALDSLLNGIFRRLTGQNHSGIRLLRKLGAYRKIIKKTGVDIMWFPFATPETFVPALPSIATIHDIYRYHYGTKKEARVFKKFILNDSTRLVCVSESTKRDIVQSLHCTKAISVIPNSIELDMTHLQAPSGLSAKYILDINAYIAKKNAMTLLEAFLQIKDAVDYDLVFCGGYKEDAYYAKMQNFIEQHSLSNRVKMYYQISDEERSYLLQHASLFVTPSLFEGWGRTPVEAAIFEVPVLSTKETSLYEATAGLVNYVENPKDATQMAKTIKNLLFSPPTKEHLASIASKLKVAYNSTECAKKYLPIFAI